MLSEDVEGYTYWTSALLGPFARVMNRTRVMNGQGCRGGGHLGPLPCWVLLPVTEPAVGNFVAVCVSFFLG